MRKKRKYLAAMMAAAAVVLTQAGNVTVFAALETPVLNEVGTIQDPDGKVKFSYDRNGVMHTEENGVSQLCTYLGEPVEGVEYLDAVQVVKGYYVLRKNDGDLAVSTLVKEDGTVLIPYGPALISSLSDRFLKVIYAEEETENEEEAIIYFTSNVISLSPGEDDVLYKGYLQVYDLQAEKFLDDIRVTSGYTDINATDETVFVENYNGPSVLYAGDGTVINDDMGGVTRRGAFFTSRQNDSLIVYNDKLERLFDTTLSLSEISSRKDCISFYEDNKYGLLGTDGSIVIPAEYEHSFQDGGDNLIFSTDGKRGVLSTDGTVLAEDSFSTLSYMGSGYYTGSYEGDDHYALICPDGTICGNLEGYANETLVSVRQGDMEDSVYVLSDGDYTLELADAQPVALNLVKSRDSISGKYGLFETVTGTQLLDYEYTSIETSYGRVYAYKDGTYTVYEWN